MKEKVGKIMLKTNNKKVRESIKKWIVDNYDGEGYGLESKDFREICENIKRIFEKEKSSRRACWCLEDFKEWGEGLPSILDTWPLMTDEVINILGDILEETEEERSKYDGSQAWNLMASLIFREIDKAVRA